MAEIDRALTVNLRAPIALAHALAPGMMQRGRGHLSVHVLARRQVGHPRQTAIYNATKFGLRGFAAALRADLHGSGVGRLRRVSRLHPRRGHVRRLGVKLPAGRGHALVPRTSPGRSSARSSATAARSTSRR